MSEDILTRIAGYKALEVAEKKDKVTLSDLEWDARHASAPRGFRARLEAAHAPGRLALIAEVKRASPSKGLIRADFDPPLLASAYELGGAACLSVLTDKPSFQGDERHLIAARAAVELPVLRKEFLIDPWQVVESRAIGADAVLVIMAMVEDGLARDLMAEAQRWGMDVLVEVHNEAELTRAKGLGAKLIGVNNRNLRTFETDIAVTERLADQIPGDALLVTESGIFTNLDVARLERCGARAMLVGESLMRQPDVEAATRALLG
ncbi:MAG: indole-3-glycerol phosphate synthase TrpC [Phenylobacterium sp.]